METKKNKEKFDRGKFKRWLGGGGKREVRGGGNEQKSRRYLGGKIEVLVMGELTKRSVVFDSEFLKKNSAKVEFQEVRTDSNFRSQSYLR